jgi:hypothetical protein
VNIGSAVELKKFVKSTWLKEHSNELFREFNNIKSYIVRNWPGASRLGTAAAAQSSISHTQPGSSGSKYSTLQEIGTSFLHERDKYISSLCQVIARAKESSALYSLCSPKRAMLSIEPEITSKQLSQQRASLERQAPRTTEQQFQQRPSLERQAPSTSEQQHMSQERRVSVEAETSVTPDQERRASFLREREEYASSLEQIIAQARERSASCSPCQTTRSIAIAPVNLSFTAMNETMTFTTIVDCSSLSSVFEDSENEVLVVDDSNRLSKRPASSQGEGVIPKRIALGVLDSNARRSPRSKKGRNCRYNHVEYVL